MRAGPDRFGAAVAVRLIASALVALAGAGAGLALWRHGVTLLLAVTAPRVEEVVAAGVAWAGSALAAWYAVTAAACAACLLGRVAGAVWTWGERAVGRAGAPLVRRLTWVGAGAALAAGAVLAPAHAAPWTPPSGVAPVLDDDLTWATGIVPAPDPPAGPAATAVEPGGATDHPPVDGVSLPAAPGDPPPGPVGHTVRPGESLWLIAAGTLGHEASDARVAAEWPRWYAANVDVIGADPDIIHPGQVLAPPRTTP